MVPFEQTFGPFNGGAEPGITRDVLDLRELVPEGGVLIFMVAARPAETDPEAVHPGIMRVTLNCPERFPDQHFDAVVPSLNADGAPGFGKATYYKVAHDPEREASELYVEIWRQDTDPDASGSVFVDVRVL